MIFIGDYNNGAFCGVSPFHFSEYWQARNGGTESRFEDLHEQRRNQRTRCTSAHFEYFHHMRIHPKLTNPAANTRTAVQETSYRAGGHARSGLRSYSPALGRWLNRDPIGEGGGLNLFCFVRNQAVTKVDYLGNRPADLLGGTVTADCSFGTASDFADAWKATNGSSYLGLTGAMLDGALEDLWYRDCSATPVASPNSYEPSLTYIAEKYPLARTMLSRLRSNGKEWPTMTYEDTGSGARFAHMLNKITVRGTTVFSAEEIQNNIVHEIVHAYDYSRGKFGGIPCYSRKRTTEWFQTEIRAFYYQPLSDKTRTNVCMSARGSVISSCKSYWCYWSAKKCIDSLWRECERNGNFWISTVTDF